MEPQILTLSPNQLSVYNLRLASLEAFPVSFSSLEAFNADQSWGPCYLQRLLC
jgi:hypothetical protein